MEFYKQLGEKLKKARIDANKSQESLAQILGLSRVTVVNIEKGRQKILIHNLVAAANFLEVKLSDLLPSEQNDIEVNQDIVSKINRKFTDELKANSVQNFVRTTLSNLK